MVEEKNDFQRLNPLSGLVTFTIDPDPETPGDVPIHYTLGQFSFVKSLMILEELALLADKVDIGPIFSDGLRTDLLIDKLPVLLRTMRPTIMRIFSLILIKNKRFEEIADDETALAQAINEVRPALNRLNVNKGAELLRVGIEQIGIQDIKKNFPMLLAALQA